MSRLAVLRHIFHIFGLQLVSLTTAWMARYHRFLGKLTSYFPPRPHSTSLLHSFLENMLSLTRWLSMPNNLSNHSTNQVTWEGYSNNNFVFRFEKNTVMRQLLLYINFNGFQPTPCFSHLHPQVWSLMHQTSPLSDLTTERVIISTKH